MCHHVHCRQRSGAAPKQGTRNALADYMQNVRGSDTPTTASRSNTRRGRARGRARGRGRKRSGSSRAAYRRAHSHESLPSSAAASSYKRSVSVYGKAGAGGGGGSSGSPRASPKHLPHLANARQSSPAHELKLRQRRELRQHLAAVTSAGGGASTATATTGAKPRSLAAVGRSSSENNVLLGYEGGGMVLEKAASDVPMESLMRSRVSLGGRDFSPSSAASKHKRFDFGAADVADVDLEERGSPAPGPPLRRVQSGPDVRRAARLAAQQATNHSHQHQHHTAVSRLHPPTPAHGYSGVHGGHGNKRTRRPRSASEGSTGAAEARNIDEARRSSGTRRRTGSTGGSDKGGRRPSQRQARKGKRSSGGGGGGEAGSGAVKRSAAAWRSRARSKTAGSEQEVAPPKLPSMRDVYEQDERRAHERQHGKQQQSLPNNDTPTPHQHSRQRYYCCPGHETIDFQFRASLQFPPASTSLSSESDDGTI